MVSIGITLRNYIIEMPSDPREFGVCWNRDIYDIVSVRKEGKSK
jgi:hypothetical protein